MEDMLPTTIKITHIIIIFDSRPVKNQIAPAKTKGKTGRVPANLILKF